MVDAPDSSLTRIRRSLPTSSGVQVLVGLRVLAQGVHMQAGLVGEGGTAHIGGSWSEGGMLAISST